MTDDNEPKREDEPQSSKTADPGPRRAPARRDDSEKAIGLEMARLFGMNPKLMMAPKGKPEDSEKALSKEPDSPALDVGEAALPGGEEGLVEE